MDGAFEVYFARQVAARYILGFDWRGHLCLSLRWGLIRPNVSYDGPHAAGYGVTFGMVEKCAVRTDEVKGRAVGVSRV